MHGDTIVIDSASAPDGITAQWTLVFVPLELSVSEDTLAALAAEDEITLDEAYRRHNAECLLRFGRPLRRRALEATTC